MRRRRARRALLVMIGLLLLVGACDEAGTPPDGSARPHPSSLEGSRWSVVSVGGLAPVPGAEPTIAFSGPRVNGSGGCNLGGEYQYDSATGELAFGNLAMTAMGCLDARRNTFEGNFFKALAAVTVAETAPDGRLVLDGAAGAIVLTSASQPLATD